MSPRTRGVLQDLAFTVAVVGMLTVVYYACRHFQKDCHIVSRGEYHETVCR